MALPNTPQLGDSFTEQVRSRLLGQKSLQSRRFYYRGTVAAATTVELSADGVSGQRIGVPEDCCVLIKATFTIFTDAATPLSLGGSKVYLFRRNGAGNVTQVATDDADDLLYDFTTLEDTGQDGIITEASAQGVVDLAADTTNQAVIVNLTGTTTTVLYCEVLLEIIGFASPKQATVAYLT